MEKNKTLYLMCGVSGSGKSTYIQKYLTPNCAWCSRDLVRFSLLEDNDNYFSKENEVFNKWINNINSEISNDKIDIIYVDATHLTPKARNKVLDKLSLNNVDIIPISFELPLKTCLERNAKRTGRALVPEDTIINMYQGYKAPTMNEKYKYKKIIKITE